MKRFSKVLSLVLATALALGLFTFSPIKASASDGITEFVSRCYSLALQREPDANGLNNWINCIKNGERVGSTVVYYFIFSEEYKAQDKTDEEFVNDLYTMFLGRPADQDGYNTWCGLMKEGWSREKIFGGFANSVEFDKLCGGYGITAGYYTTEYPMDQVNAVNLFVERLYKTCLGRLGDQGGQKTWVEGMLNGTFNGTQCATNFIKSPEYENKGLTDEQYVENLYVGFMGREYDEAGKAAWLQLLSEGTMTRDQVFEGFANSTEFNNICTGYGIECGEYKATDVADPGKNQGNPDDNKQGGNDTNPNKKTFEDGSWEEYEYDANGNLVKLKKFDDSNVEGFYELDYWIEYEYSSAGKTEYWYDGMEGYLLSKHEYDRKGNKVKSTYYQSDDSLIVTEYESGKESKTTEYNSAGKPTKVTIYNTDGSVKKRTEYEYDAKGYILKEKNYDKNGNMYSQLSYEYEYDAQGRISKETHRDLSGDVFEWLAYEYNANGYKKMQYNATDVLKYIFEYDANGNMVRSSECNEAGDVWKDYEYDKNGNLIKSTQYWTNRKEMQVTEYDENGNEVKNSWYTEEGNLNSWAIAEYDNDGNCTKTLQYDSDDTLLFYNKYEYDADGNKTKWVEYNTDGSKTGWTGYEYDADGNMLKEEYHDADDSLIYVSEFVSGNLNAVKKTWYNEDGWKEEVVEYNELGLPTRTITYDAAGNIISDVSH